MIRRKKKTMVYTAEFKKELDRRYESMKNGTAIMVSAEESNRRIKEILAEAAAKQKVNRSANVRRIWPFSKPCFQI